MSFALPFVRSVTDDASENRLAGLGLAAIALFLFTLAAFSPQVLGDGDTWSHVATGEWIIAHGAAPRADPFSHSMPGAPWTAHEWLSEVLLALALRVGGWSGVVLLTSAAAAAAALIVGLTAARQLRGAPLVLTVAIGLSLVTANLLARPHVLALPLAAAWGAGLLAARDRGRAPPIGLAALMIAWVNMHGGFIFGLLLIGPFALETVTEAPVGARLLAARAWATFALAALAVALINPYGIDAFLLPFRLMSVENLSRISEWRPQDFSHIGTMELALLTLLGLTLIRPFSMPPIRAALLIALVAMALQHSRHQVLLGILAPMLLARPIAAAIGMGSAGEEGRRIARIALTATVAAAPAIGGARLIAPIERTDGASAPISALRAVPPELRAKPVLNDYAFGGYLIFEHVRPFIDGRAELYGDAMMSLYGRLQAGDEADVESALKRYGIAWTIFAPDSRMVAILDRKPGWRRLYADATAVVHVRDAAPEAEGLRGD
ncbi:MAG TPA: hypothetical protein VIH81_11585 [Roseiarcus sp.]